MTYTVELKHARTRKRLWAEITRVIPVPFYFGNNLDAFYDILTDLGEDTEIVFRNTDICRKHLRVYTARLIDMCRDAENDNPHLKIRFEE